MDNRKKNTDRKIKDTFIELMKTKQPDKITAKELCLKAGINRSTFYTHYPYIEVLLKDIIHDQIMIICYGEDYDRDLYQKDMTAVARQDIRDYIHSFRQNAILRRFMLSDNAVVYVDMMVKEQVELVLKEYGYSPERYYHAYFENIAATATITRWIMEGERISEDQLINIIENFFNKPCP